MPVDPTHAPDVTRVDPTAFVSGTLPAVPGYQLIRELGRGGIGSVYEARQDDLGRTVALKVVRSLNPKALIRFHAHADAVAAVCHPNLVQIYDYAEHDGQPILSLEFVPGGNLFDRLQDVGRMSGRTAATLAIGIARGLAAAHAAQLVHGELKPGNVLLDAAGEPKVSDFGFGRCVSGPDAPAMGNPAYVAPELVSGTNKFVGPSVDVWSLGCILYECITGRRPFQADTTLELLNAICVRDPERPTQLVAELHRDLELVCLKCLAKNPTERYSSAAEVADDLTRFLAGEPVSARVPVPAERLVRWARRNKPFAVFASGTLILMVVGLVVSIIMWQRTERLLAEADVARMKEEHLAADSMAARAQAEEARVMEKKRADEAGAGRQAADRTTQELAGSAADLIGVLFAHSQHIPADPNSKNAVLDGVAVWRRIAASPSTTPQMQTRLSVAFVLAGKMLEAQGTLAEAAELYREAVDLARPAAVANPKDRQAVSPLATSLSHRAAILARLGKVADALPLVLEAVKLDQSGMISAEPPDRPFWRGNLCLRLETLADVYRGMGQRRDAERTLQDAKALVQNVDQLRLIAGDFALLAATVPQPGTAEDAKEKEQHLANAIETLRVAVEGGWRFPSQRSYKSSTIDNADFRPFQDHPEIKKLLAEASKK